MGIFGLSLVCLRVITYYLGYPPEKPTKWHNKMCSYAESPTEIGQFVQKMLSGLFYLFECNCLCTVVGLYFSKLGWFCSNCWLIMVNFVCRWQAGKGCAHHPDERSIFTQLKSRWNWNRLWNSQTLHPARTRKICDVVFKEKTKKTIQWVPLWLLLY